MGAGGASAVTLYTAAYKNNENPEVHSYALDIVPGGSFIGANLVNANLNHAHLTGSNFSGAKSIWL